MYVYGIDTRLQGKLELRAQNSELSSLSFATSHLSYIRS